MSNIGKEVIVVKNKQRFIELLKKVLIENLNLYWSATISEVFEYPIEIPVDEALKIAKEFYDVLVKCITNIDDIVVL